MWCSGWVSSSHFGSWGDPENERQKQPFVWTWKHQSRPWLLKHFLIGERNKCALFRLLMGAWDFSHIWKSFIFPQPFQPLKNSMGGPYKKEKNKKKNLSLCIWVDFLTLDTRKAFLGRLMPFLTVSFEIAHYALKEPEPAANYPMEITHCVGCLLFLCA